MAVSVYFKHCSAPTLSLIQNWMKAHAAHHFKRHNPNFFGIESSNQSNRLNHWSWYDLRRSLIALSSDKYLRTANANASQNLLTWKKNQQKPAGIVTVHGMDWGQLAQIKTRSHGEMYAILHETDAKFPCGIYFGQSSKTLPYFLHRTTFALSLGYKNIHYDQGTQQFTYHPSMQQLLAGKQPMNMDEALIVARSTQYRVQQQNMYKTFLNPFRMLYLKGNELITYANTQHDIPENFQESNLRMQLRPLSEPEIFPFIELRAAKMGNNIQQAIDAQLDTLISHQLRYVILSDWGCIGYDGSIAQITARTYREAILKRPHCFSDISFAIQNEKHVDIFKNILEGLPLSCDDAHKKSQNCNQNDKASFVL